MDEIVDRVAATAIPEVVSLGEELATNSTVRYANGFMEHLYPDEPRPITAW